MVRNGCDKFGHGTLKFYLKSEIMELTDNLRAGTISCKKVTENDEVGMNKNSCGQSCDGTLK